MKTACELQPLSLNHWCVFDPCDVTHWVIHDVTHTEKHTNAHTSKESQYEHTTQFYMNYSLIWPVKVIHSALCLCHLEAGESKSASFIYLFIYLKFYAKCFSKLPSEIQALLFIMHTFFHPFRQSLSQVTMLQNCNREHLVLQHFLLVFNS